MFCKSTSILMELSLMVSESSHDWQVTTFIKTKALYLQEIARYGDGKNRCKWCVRLPRDSVDVLFCCLLLLCVRQKSDTASFGTSLWYLGGPLC